MERVVVAVLGLVDPAAAQVDVGQAGGVGQPVVELAGVVEVGVGVVVAADPRVELGEPAVGVGLRAVVVQAPRGVQGGVGGAVPVVPVSPAVEERAEQVGQSPGVGFEAGLGGGVDRGDERGVFAGEPVECLGVAGQWFRRDVGAGGARVVGSRCGPSSRRAVLAVCR
ncbi:hypothetical protein Psuf_069810 [Phytohabitans suffuscus]|uniref:Uncharacterized protein n=1 Tax=Phytohabitans suffuscus TaxID=624315 RepID=A0A6F8YUQ2_9ACTN|nr:hypothetical protein [Phytohabitans suffuscus]BCB89668.1 hypothetical protein Psuf_069810 [Phytohabitans suffuscus]